MQRAVHEGVPEEQKIAEVESKSQPQTVQLDDKPKSPIANIETLLATAIIEMVASNGATTKARALCDSGSQVNLITTSCADGLGISRRPYRGLVGCIGSSQLKIKGCVSLKIKPRFESDFSMEIELLVGQNHVALAKKSFGSVATGNRK